MGRGGIPQQRLKVFVEAYATDCNAGKAAKAAGYTGPRKRLSDTGNRLLKRPDVQAMLAELNKEASEALRLTREQRQRFWSQLITGDELELDLLDPTNGRVRRVKMKPSIANRLKASELLGKSEGDFVKRVEVQHHGNVVITVELPDNGRGDAGPDDKPTE